MANHSLQIHPIADQHRLRGQEIYFNRHANRHWNHHPNSNSNRDGCGMCQNIRRRTESNWLDFGRKSMVNHRSDTCLYRLQLQCLRFLEIKEFVLEQYTVPVRPAKS